MKYLLLIPMIWLSAKITYGQMDSEDSLLQDQVNWLDFDCYNDMNSYQVYMKYSNEQESCIIYNLKEKDSIVKYYYSGEVASIGIYYGCYQDTLWLTSFTEIFPGKNIPIPNLNVGETLTKEKYFVTIDSAEYIFFTHYQLSCSPVYEMTLFDQDGKVMEREWKRHPKFIDFKKIIRRKYANP